MSSEDDTFEMAFRIAGAEVLGFKLVVNDFKVKWVLLGLGTTAALVWLANYAGIL